MKTYKIGIISDIHGNEVALNEVLKILQNNVDEIICLGDIIGIGPNGNDVINIVSKLNNFSTVLGNHERYYLYGFNNPLSCTGNEHQNWIKAQISEENGEYIRTIPVEIRREYNGKKLLFLHYARKNFEELKFELIKKNANYDDLNDIYKKYDADIIFYGHEHIASIFDKERKFINPGSLGCPYTVKNQGRYGILEVSDNNIDYHNYTFTYDSSKITTDMFNKKMPNAEFIAKNFFLYER